MRKRLDLTGKKFGRLIVVAEAGRNKWDRLLWWCLCDCGELIIIAGESLTKKQHSTKSCGCLKREFAGKQVKIHGQSGSLTYWIWANMKARCFYIKHIEFENYGGRGITVCDRWLKFENFIADMGPRPSDNHTIERIHNDKNYEPKNCKWLLQSINNRNKRIYKNNTTGCKGVHWNKINKTYIVTIGTNNKHSLYLGSFKHLQEAIEVRKAAELKYW